MLSISNGDSGSSVRTKLNNELATGFTTLTFAATTDWDTGNLKNPIAKVTATGNFTINMTNVISGSNGTLKVISNTASAFTMTFDTDFTNTTLEGFNSVAMPTYTFQAGTGKEYFLSYICDGTTLYWTIVDPSGTNGVYAAWTPTFGGYSVDPTGVTARYTLIGKMCDFYMAATGNGTSNLASTTFTLPVPAANTAIQSFKVGLIVDNGTSSLGGIAKTRVNSNIVDCFKDEASIPYTNTGAKRAFVFFHGTYETI